MQINNDLDTTQNELKIKTTKEFSYDEPKKREKL